MGYCINVDGWNFFIEAGKKADALAACKTLVERTELMGGGDNKGNRWFSWVDTDTLRAAETLEDFMEEWRYTPSVDENGNIEYLTFEGEKWGDETHLFKALGPYVRKDSYLEFRGEDGEMWRFIFDGEKMIEQQAIITWE